MWIQYLYWTLILDTSIILTIHEIYIITEHQIRVHIGDHKFFEKHNISIRISED